MHNSTQFVSALCHNSVDRAMAFEILGFNTLENKTSKVSNLKCGWRCQGFLDTLVTLFESPARKLYDKPNVVFFTSHALWVREARHIACNI